MSRTLPPGSLLVLVGPTGVGKTEMALRLAERLPLEIINADSRQIYRYLDVGTAKPAPAQRRQVPHHLFDIRDPDQVLSLAEFQALAHAAVNGILARGRQPLLVGGTPLYVRAVIQNLRIPAVEPDPQLRRELEAQLAIQGVEALFARLQQLDPDTAADTDPRNGRRIVRALEVFLKTGQSKRHLEGVREPDWPICTLGLTCPRPELHRRVDARVEAMMQQGLPEETRSLLEAGYDPALPAMTALGYRWTAQYLAGTISRAEAVRRTQYDTHRYIRHQYTWFRRLPDITWFEMGPGTQVATAAAILAFLACGAGTDKPVPVRPHQI